MHNIQLTGVAYNNSDSVFLINISAICFIYILDIYVFLSKKLDVNVQVICRYNVTF